MNTKTTALIAAGALIAAPLATIATAGSAQADSELTKRGACGAGIYDFQVEREDAEDGGGYDVSVDIDRVAPGSTWTIVVRHDGRRVGKVTRVADNEGDVELDVDRPNTAGKDTFTFRASSGGKSCTATITRR